MVEGNGINVLVEDESARDRKVENREALGTKRVGQNFDSVRDDEWREGKAIRQYSLAPFGTIILITNTYS